MSGPTDWGSWVGFGFPQVGLADDERMAVAQNQDGHLEVFVVGSDGAVWHRWQTAPNGIWSEWAPFGQTNGVSFAVQFVSPIQVEQNEDGRLEVFLAGSDNNVWHIWQTSQNNGWSGWGSLGRPGVSIGGSSLVRNQAGELEIFIEVNNRGGLWSRRQVDPNGKQGWEPNWNVLGFPSPAIRSFSAVLNANKQLEVLAIGGDDAIWHNVRGGFPPAWRGWSVVVDPPSGVSLLGIEALWRNQDGRLELVCSARNLDYWHTWQVSPPSPDHWSGFWDNFGQPPGGTSRGFGMRLDSNGLLEGLTWGNDFRTYQISQSAPNNGWTGWSVLSSDTTVFKAPLMVMSQNQNGRLEAFTRGSGNTIWHVAQTR